MSSLEGYVEGLINLNGGGSNVEITPTLETGTKIAEYTIDEENGELYAPTPTTYSAGENVQISEQNVISATDTTYSAGENVQISEQNVISATDTTYSAGEGISINNGVISATGGSMSNIYSANETLVGVWLGDNLYRKVITYSNNPTTNSWVKVAEVDGIIKKYSGIVYFNSDLTNGFPIDYANPRDGNNYCSSNLSDNGKSIYIMKQSNVTVYGVVLIVEYIKTEE